MHEPARHLDQSQNAQNKVPNVPKTRLEIHCFFHQTGLLCVRDANASSGAQLLHFEKPASKSALSDEMVGYYYG
jgi:hypothetical protein